MRCARLNLPDLFDGRAAEFLAFALRFSLYHDEFIRDLRQPAVTKILLNAASYG
jgi:hypothetical protein